MKRSLLFYLLIALGCSFTLVGQKSKFRYQTMVNYKLGMIASEYLSFNETRRQDLQSRFPGALNFSHTIELEQRLQVHQFIASLGIGYMQANLRYREPQFYQVDYRGDTTFTNLSVVEDKNGILNFTVGFAYDYELKSGHLIPYFHLGLGLPVQRMALIAHYNGNELSANYLGNNEKVAPESLISFGMDYQSAAIWGLRFNIGPFVTWRSHYSVEPRWFMQGGLRLGLVLGEVNTEHE